LAAIHVQTQATAKCGIGYSKGFSRKYNREQAWNDFINSREKKVRQKWSILE
jgi:hypothetical protein